jgi:hypothetical protein
MEGAGDVGVWVTNDLSAGVSRVAAAGLLLAVVLAACGGGGSGSRPTEAPTPTPAPTPTGWTLTVTDTAFTKQTYYLDMPGVPAGKTKLYRVQFLAKAVGVADLSICVYDASGGGENNFWVLRRAMGQERGPGHRLPGAAHARRLRVRVPAASATPPRCHTCSASSACVPSRSLTPRRAGIGVR